MTTQKVLMGGGGDPPLDGVTPVFEEVGAAPTAGLDRPPGSLARFGAHYYWKYGTGTTDWSIDPFSGGSGGSPLTTKGDLYGFTTVNARIPVGTDGTFLVADSTAAAGVSYKPKFATWTRGTASPRYFAIDPVGGSDANAGFSDVSAAAAWTVRKQTLAGFLAILPQYGVGRSFVLLHGAGTYAYDLDFLGAFGYSNAHMVGTTDGSYDATDRILLGGATAQAGPNGDSSWTCAAGGSATLIVTAAGALPAEGGNTGCTGWRVRFLATTTTVALRNKCATIYSNTASQIVPGDNLPAAPVAGDFFMIERPGVVYNGVNLYQLADTISLAGIATATTIATGTFGWQATNIGATVSLAFCEQRTTSPFFLFANVGTLNMQRTYSSIANASTTVGGVRIEGTSSLSQISRVAGNCTCLVRGGGGATNSWSNIPIFTWGQGCVAFVRPFFSQIGAGWSSFDTGVTSTYSVLGGAVTSFQPFRLSGTTASTALQLMDCNLSLQNVVGSASGTATAIIRVQGLGCRVEFLNCTGSTSAGGSQGIDISGVRDGSFFFNTGNTVTGAAGDILAGGSGIIAHADTQLVGFTDPQGNVINGGATLTSGLAVAATNSSGGALAVGDVVRVSAAGAVSKSDASLLSRSKIDGVWLTTTANGIVGYMAAPTSSIPRVNVDGLCTPGQQLYLSPTTPGTLTSTRPSGTNQLLRAGHALTQSASQIRAALCPETEASVVPVNITSAGGTILSGATVELFSAVQTEPWDVAVQLVTNPASAYVGEWANDTGAAGLSTYLQRKTDGTTALVTKNNTAISVAANWRVMGWPGG